jgi:hypothetical protein
MASNSSQKRADGPPRPGSGHVVIDDGLGGQPVESWDVPNISDGYDAARKQIVDKVERLVAGMGGR